MALVLFSLSLKPGRRVDGEDGISGDCLIQDEPVKYYNENEFDLGIEARNVKVKKNMITRGSLI